MKINKLWDLVRENLKNAIDNVNDETTELVVIPFADNTLTNPTLVPFSALATTEGKRKLKDQISALPMNKNTMTYHYIPITDFYENRVSDDRVTYMFLMTDGQDEDSAKRFERVFLPQWGEKFGDKNVYGFYVMLHDSARNNAVEVGIKEQLHIWKVESADVNVNLIRLQNDIVFNVRNDKYFDIPYYGTIDNLSFNMSFPSTVPYKVNKVERIGNKLRVFVDIENKLYDSADVKLSISMSGGGAFDFLVTDAINIRCENKIERSLKITVQ